ncbi:MAG: cation:dicarboxylase symporter family transporter [Atopobiaceae bacterium]|nr:cation:dicarboxylase symporter family transporter [Atopobiaceae bacterium]
MSRSIQTLTFSLRAQDIDRFSDWLDDAQMRLQIERQNRTRVRLFMEDILLRMYGSLGTDVQITAACEVRFGRPRIRLEFKGTPFNPLGDLDAEMGGWDTSLCTAIGLAPQYAYDAGNNVIRMNLPHNSMNPVARIAIAILIGAAIGFLGNVLIDSVIRNPVVNVLLVPTYNMWSRLLNAISGPIIFLTVITTMLNTQRITERGGNSFFVIARYFLISILVVAVALLCVRPFFYLDRNAIVINNELFIGMLDDLLGVVPSNMFDPFSQSNTSQLLFIALSMGLLLVRLGSRVETLRQIVREANVVGLAVARGVSWLVPIFSGMFLCLEIWQERTHGPMELWLPLVVSLVTSLVCMLVSLLLVSRVLKVSPLLLAKKIWEPFFIALKTGSLDDSLSKTQFSCTNLLGIESDYVKAGLPQGLVLYMPISAVGTIIFTLFVAHTNGVQGNTLWYVSAILMAVVVFVATPPVPGANLLAYVVLFTTLGIPDDALLDAMIFDIIFGIFAGAANQTMLQLEMLNQANRFGLLDKTTLRSTMAPKG